MKKLVFLLLLSVITFNLFSQQTYYHSLRETRTQPFIYSWNVDKEDLLELHSIEKTDAQNRVIEIRIQQGDRLYPMTCKVSPITKYEYNKNMIIVHRYEMDGVYVTNVRCGKGQKTIFYLENGKIKNSIDYIVDFSAFEPDENSTDFYIKYYEEKILPYKEGVPGKWKEIPGYGYSFKKMNGKNPVK